MTRRGEIDRVRYPNFARLAHDATWFSRATTVHDNTTAAVPAILDGRLPRDGGLPTLAHHPENLFTLLGESYGLRVTEAVTYLCPKRYCPRPRDPFLHACAGCSWTRRSGSCTTFSRNALAGVAERARSLGRIREGADSGRDRLPRCSRSRATEGTAALAAARVRRVPRRHRSWRAGGHAAFRAPDAPPHTLAVLPIGSSYGDTPIPIGLAPGLLWSDQPWLIRQALQRHLLQVGYTDALLGSMLDKLERSGVVRSSARRRRRRSRRQFHRRRDIEECEPRETSLTSRQCPFSSSFRTKPKDLSTRVRRERSTFFRRSLTCWTCSRRGRWTGARCSIPGRDRRKFPLASPTAPSSRRPGVRCSKGWQSPSVARRHSALAWDSLLSAGLPPRLVGYRTGATQRWRARDARVQLDNEESFIDVDLSSLLVPARITGSIEGSMIRLRHCSPPSTAGLSLRRAAFSIRGKQRFSALVPESAFRDGFNRVELFASRHAPGATAPNRRERRSRPS